METDPPPPPSTYGPFPVPPPASHAPPEAAPPSGAGARTGAAVVLFLLGAASVAYNGWDLWFLAEDLEIFDRAGMGTVGSALLAIDGALIVSGLLQVAGGVGILAKRSRGRGLGLAGCAGAVLGWVAFLVLVVGRELLAGVSVTAWVMMLISVSGSVLAGGLLLVGREPLAPPGPEAA
jgi:hypothetical protein